MFFSLPRRFRFTFLLCLILMLNTAKSQSPFYPLAKDVSPFTHASLLIQYQPSGFGQVPLLGIGPSFTGTNSPPQAIFHIKKPQISSTPLLKVETDDFGAIKYFFSNSTRNYAIYQTQTGDSVFNYLESPFVTPLTFFGANTGIGALCNEPFRFSSQPAPTGMIYFPMEMYHWGIKITDTLECNNFRLHDQSGIGKILVSDRRGVGTWTDPSSIGGNWLINRYGDMYSNTANSPVYQHVGIGFQTSTEKIYERLHIIDGNILLTPSHGGNLLSHNGSILFGDQTSDDCSHGNWGIEYYNGGLNFWKVPCDGTRGSNDNYILFLMDDHSVGIGTNDTKGYKLAVDGNVICEELKVKLSEYWPDYVLKHDYKLPSLKDVEVYIDKNQHLSGIPSAEEISKNGLSVGEINVALVKKVEELTKYLIEQQKQIDELKEKIDADRK